MSNVYAFGQRLAPEAHMQSLVDDAHRAMIDIKTGMNNFPTFFLDVLKERAWEHRRALDGGMVEPMSFADFIREPYPRGLGTTYEAVEHFVKAGTHEGHRIEALALWTEITKKGAGAPEGNRNAAAKSETIVDIVNDCKPERPTGNSAEAGLRRLQKNAGEGNADARENLAEVIAGNKSVHRACQDMGWRPKATATDVADEASRRLAELIGLNFNEDELIEAHKCAEACGARRLAKSLGHVIASRDGSS